MLLRNLFLLSFISLDIFKFGWLSCVVSVDSIRVSLVTYWSRTELALVIEIYHLGLAVVVLVTVVDGWLFGWGFIFLGDSSIKKIDSFLWGSRWTYTIQGARVSCYVDIAFTFQVIWICWVYDCWCAEGPISFGRDPKCSETRTFTDVSGVE